VKLAQARWLANKDKPLGKMTCMGLDVAQGGEDRTVLAPVHGLRFESLIPIPGALTTDGPAVAAAVLRYSRNDPTIAVDLGGGWGGGALSHLKQLNQYAIGSLGNLGVITGNMPAVQTDLTFHFASHQHFMDKGKLLAGL